MQAHPGGQSCHGEDPCHSFQQGPVCSGRAGDRYPVQSQREILGDDSSARCGRPKPERCRVSILRGSRRDGPRRRAVHSRSGFLSDASHRACRTRPSRWNPALALATFPLQDRSGTFRGPRAACRLQPDCPQGAGVKLSEVFTAPNQLTLLRMIFVPFIVIHLVDGHYLWALVLFVVAGFSDGLDGLLARRLHQQTLLGQYLDPIADKLLLSTMFLILSILHKIPWKYTVVVFSRDISILAASAVLFTIAGLRNFRPSIFGKANTFSQISAVFFVLALEVYPLRWILIAPTVFPAAAFYLTIVSALHYVILVQQRLRNHQHALPPPSAST